jgi:hypothetical protein
MKLPAGARDLGEGIALLSQRYDRIRQFILAEIDQLAKSGFADQRWCAIARTDIEKGFLSLNQAMPDARDGREYGKVPHPDNPNPASFTPPVGDAEREPRPVGIAPLPQIEWKDLPLP